MEMKWYFNFFSYGSKRGQCLWLEQRQRGKFKFGNNSCDCDEVADDICSISCSSSTVVQYSRSTQWQLVTSSAPDSWPHSGLQTVVAIHYSVQATIQRIQGKFSFISGPRFILPAHLITNAVYWKHHRYVLRFTALNHPGLLYNTVHYVLRLLCRMYVFITNITFTTNNLGVIIHKTCCNKKNYTN